MDEEIFQDNRFVQLLEPVRDLAKNWDIDLAALLDTYMHDLETFNVNILPTPQAEESQGSTSMNFAQAALLIQGSALIYSKKVEYLYELTLNLWEFLAKKNAEEARKRAHAENDEEAGETPVGQMQTRQSKKHRGQEEDDEGPLAPLDDIEVGLCRESVNVDLKEEAEPVDRKKRRRHKRIKLLKPMPLELVPLEDYEKSDVPLITKAGEVVGKKDDYLVNTCFMHECGALFLDLSNAELVAACKDPASKIPSRPDSVIAELAGLRSGGSPYADNANTSGIPRTDSPASASSYPNQTSPTLPAGGQTDLMLAVGNESFGPELVNQSHLERTMLVGRNSCRADEKNRRNMAETLERNKEELKRREEQIAQNALALLDEFEECESKALLKKRAAKMRRTYRLPDCLKNKQNAEKCADDIRIKKRKKDTGERKADATEIKKKCQLPAESLSQFFDAVLFDNRYKMPKNPLKVVAFTELDDLLYEEQRRRRNLGLKASRLRSGKLRINAELEQLDQQLTAIKDQPLNQEQANDEENIMSETLLDQNLMAIFEGPDSPDTPLAGQNDQELAPHVSNDIDLLDIDFAGGSARCSLDSQAQRSDLLIDQFATYEQLVKRNVEQHLLRAQQNAHLSDLAQRVREWGEKIAPLLALEENRRVFDINLYGDEILQFLRRTNPKAPLLFADFAFGKEQYEICRYTLASLMLANHENIEISASEDSNNCINTMKLRYLMSERHRQKVVEYVAPSRQK